MLFFCSVEVFVVVVVLFFALLLFLFFRSSLSISSVPHKYSQNDRKEKWGKKKDRLCVKLSGTLHLWLVFLYFFLSVYNDMHHHLLGLFSDSEVADIMEPC